MASSVDNMFISKPNTYTQTTKYRGSLETLRAYFLSLSTTQAVAPDRELLHLYRGDLMGLLLHYNARLEDHYIIMRINDLSSLHDVDDDTQILYLPDPESLQAFKLRYIQANKIKV